MMIWSFKIWTTTSHTQKYHLSLIGDVNYERLYIWSIPSLFLLLIIFNLSQLLIIISLS